MPWAASDATFAQTSSLYLQEPPPPPAGSPVRIGVPDQRSDELVRTSLASVLQPEPRQFALHDLITIIVRESVESDSESNLDTEKKLSTKAKINRFPDLQLKDLLQFRVRPGDTEGDRPELDLSYNGKFEGDGDYNRKDSFVARITARVIDIRPNGTLVLEARKFIQSDDESLSMLLTGTCRKEDVAADNTVLSTQLYDLRVVKEHTGELRRATKKGWLTKLVDTVFNF